MASVTGITAAHALSILGESVTSGFINGSGHLILVRDNGSTIDAGDFTAIVTGILDTEIDSHLAAQLPAAAATAVAGTLFAKGNITGAVSFTGFTATNLVNAIITATLTGNITIAATDLPAAPKPGTQFAFRMTQDATGGRTLTLTGFKKSMGVLTLSTPANSVDIIMFFYDGAQWYAGAMGMAFS